MRPSTATSNPIEPLPQASRALTEPPLTVAFTDKDRLTRLVHHTIRGISRVACQAVDGAIVDGVMISLLIVLSDIGGICGVVGVCIESAILSQRHTILEQHVCVEEAADLGCAAIGWRMRCIIRGL